MKVTISCAGRFHAYNLASQLNRLGYLESLITTYPKREVVKYGIPVSKVKSILYWELLSRGSAKWCKWTGMNVARFHPLLYEIFETAAARNIPQHTNCFIGWSAWSEKGLKRAKTIGALTILERGSSHIEFQTDILTHEYKKYNKEGLKVFTHPKVVEKELREYELADYISVPSTFVKQSFIDKGFAADKIIQNPYGVNIEKFKPGLKKDKIFRVIYVGQMSLRKGVHYLLDAFTSLKLKNAELLLIGNMTEEMEPYMKQYNANVVYIGPQPQDQLYRYYHEASVFILCSIEEGMAMVQAQAAACGLPLICTTNTGGEDLIRDGKEGFIIPIRDVRAIQEKIEWMYLHQEDAYEMGKLARKRISEGFSWDDYGNRYAANIKSIMGHEL